MVLYSAGLQSKYSLSALLHAVYLQNQRYHQPTGTNLFEAWNGLQPDLKDLCLFGSRVCVKISGKQHDKLDKHEFFVEFSWGTPARTQIFDILTLIAALLRFLTMQYLMKHGTHHLDLDPGGSAPLLSRSHE